jgi:hypothetical protein
MDDLPDRTVFSDGSEEWLLNGLRHREDGPAVTYPNGMQHWYFKGKLHRPDGPAVILPDGDEIWFIHDRKLSDEEAAAVKNHMALFMTLFGGEQVKSG